MKFFALLFLPFLFLAARPAGAMMAPTPPMLAAEYCNFANETLATELPDGSNQIEWQVRYNGGDWTTLPGTEPTRSFLFTNINNGDGNTFIEFRLRGMIFGDPNTDWSEVVGTEVRPESLPNIFGVDVIPPCPLFDGDLGGIFVSASAVNPLIFELTGTTEAGEVYSDENAIGNFPDLPNGVYQVRVDDGDGLCVATTETLTIAGADAGAMDVFIATNYDCTERNWRVEVVNSTSFGEGLGFSLDGVNYQSNPVFTEVPSGSYTVFSIDSMNCETDITRLDLIAPAFSVARITQPECPSSDLSLVELSVTPPQDFPSFTLFKGDEEIATSTNNLFFDLDTGFYRVETMIYNCPFSTEFTIAYTRPDFTFDVTQVSGACNGDPFVVRVDPVAEDGNLYDYEFSFGEGSAWQTDSFLTLPISDFYTVFVRYVDGGCTKSRFPIIINEPQSFEIGAETTAPECGQKNGVINVIEDFGNDFPPFEYELVNVRPPQRTPSFTALAAGDYILVGYNSAGCTDTVRVALRETGTDFGPFVVLDEPIACEGGDNGAFTVGIDGASGDFEFRLNAGPWQTDSSFTGLTAGTYDVEARLVGTDCAAATSTELFDGQSFEIGAETTPAECGLANGRIDVIEDFGNDFPPFTYELLGSRPPQDDPVFLDLPAGNYQLVGRNGNGCTDTVGVVLIDIGVDFGIFPIVQQQPGCGGQNDGAFRIIVDGATGDFEFRINGGPWQADNLFTGLEAGSYLAEARLTGDDCVVMTTVTLSVVVGLDIGAETSPTDCGLATGTVTVIPDGDNTSELVEYSLVDVRPFQTSTLFSELAGGNYTLVGRTSEGCTDTVTVVVMEEGASPNLAVRTQLLSFPLCTNLSAGSFSASVRGGRPGDQYEFSLEGGPFSEQNIFDQLVTGTYLLRTRIVGTNCPQTDTVVIPAPTGLAVSLAIENVACDSTLGIVSLNVGGGSEPYRFSLDGGESFQETGNFTGLLADSYPLLVLDQNDCELRTTITVGDNREAFRAELIDRQDPVCGVDSNGRATIVVREGTAPFAFQWADGSTDSLRTDLANGLYEVTVSNELGCTYLVPFELDQPALTLEATVSGNGCNDVGGIELRPGGGTPDYTYTWSDAGEGPNRTNLADGTYAVTVSDDNGCSISDTFEITSSSDLSVEIQLLNPPVCTGVRAGSFAVTASGGRPSDRYEFSLDDGPFGERDTFEQLTAGTYLLQTRIVGTTCAQTDTVVIPALPELSVLIEIENVTCDSMLGTVLLTATGGSEPYDFSLDGGESFQRTGGFGGLFPDTYSLLVRDLNGCEVRRTVIVEDEREAFRAAVMDQRAPTCAGDSDGRAAIVIREGSPPFNFRWADGSTDSLRTDLTNGLYEVTVTNGRGCTYLVPFELDRRPLILEATVSANGCNENSGIELSPSGGTPGYTYTWSDAGEGANRINLAEGSYAVTVSDLNNCSVSDTFEITTESSLFVPFPDTVICRESQLRLRPSFPVQEVEWRLADGFILSLSAEVTVDGGNQIFVSGLDENGCAFADDFTVSESSDALIASFLAAGQAVVGDTVVLVENSSPAPDNIQWLFRGNGPVIPIFDSLNQHWFEFPQVGTYEIEMQTSLGGCRSSLTKRIDIVADSSELTLPQARFSELVDFSLAPNPTTGPFRAEVELSAPRAVSLRVYDLNGTVVAQTESPSATLHQADFNLSGNEPGVYAVVVDTGTEAHYLTLILQ